MPKSTDKQAYENKLAYNNEYNRKNYRSFSIRFNREDEKKIIKWLEKKKNLKQYLKTLIVRDMNENALNHEIQGE